MNQVFLAVSHYRAARRLAPWASIIARCDGGYIAFRFMSDYAAWKGVA